MTEPAPFARSPCANRAQRYRQRQRDGVKVFRIPLNMEIAITGLILTGHLTDEAALDDANVTAALACFYERWLKDAKNRHA